MSKIYLRFILSLGLVFSLFTISLPTVSYAQTVTQTSVSSDLQKRLATIEEKIEARRKELGIPGLSLAIVKDGEVVLAKGYGFKDFTKQVPVTNDTQFAIGSATKAFTALSVLMSQDEGKLSLNDSPKKYLPYFKINNPETDKNIQIRDLLSHSSGLNRTDLAMITGKLTREELIRVAGEAKTTAKLREKFQYQNIMFAAAGEIVAKVQKTRWEAFVAQKILKPLGMLNSSISVSEMQKAKDYSYGYDYNFDTKETRLLPTREIAEVSPAGSINSSARDMSQWLKFVLNKGEINGKRFISEASFDEWLKPQMKISGKTSYGLGWFLQDWKGLKVAQHGGNIDGFNSLVAMIPEKRVGFVLLTNVSASSLGGEMMSIVWENLLSETTSPSNQIATNDASKEVGKYRFEAAGFDIEIKMQDGKLVGIAPGQPVYTLENVGGRKYKLAGAPAGFFVTFKDTELYLEQPQGNYTLPKAGTDAKTSGAAKELIGKYQSAQNEKAFVEVKEVEGKTSLIVKGQPSYPLIEREKDVFRSSGLPDSYSVKVKRDAGNKIESIVLAQPEGDFVFKYAGAIEKIETPKITVNELMAKTINALGGEANWRKLNSRQTKFEIDFEHQGLKGAGITYEKAPNAASSEITITALGKQIGKIHEYFDGVQGGESTSFTPADVFTGQRLEDVKLENDFYGLLNWNKNLEKAEVTTVEKVGGEEAYIVTIEPEKASETTYYISTKTFLPLKKTSIIVSSTSSQKIPMSKTFSDYRAVDGVMIPFKTVTANPGMGDIVTYIKEVKHNVAIEEKVFKPQATGKAVGKN